MGGSTGGALATTVGCTGLTTCAVAAGVAASAAVAAGEQCGPVLVPGRGAVFATDAPPGGAEQLVVVHEVDGARAGETDCDAVIEAIRTAVATHHAIAADAVVLVHHLSLPTTSSGKIQRSAATRQQFVDGRAGGGRPMAHTDRGAVAGGLAGSSQIASALQTWGPRQG